jgi:cytidine deaminase
MTLARARRSGRASRLPTPAHGAAGGKRDQDGTKPGAPGHDEELVLAARRARRHAYAPYSGFRVGAAVRDERGRVFAGCNVENASYGLGVCAERNAVAAAVAAGARRLRGLVVVTSSLPPAPPCGACLQVLAEFAAPDLAVTLAGLRGHAPAPVRLDRLLPARFRLA